MIEVSNLTKYYGDFAAVRNVSFKVASGEIVGFLGPNGAGKTTTLRVLAGYLPQSAGTVTLVDKDNRKQPLEIRREVGYLAENNPLYESMEVSEYLSFLWDTRRLGAEEEKSKRFKEIATSCGLAPVLGKEISELSKGFRQRVGLAAALIHNPKILLLDEPTSGLDPIQAKEVRDLIKSMKKEKTILLSTHILSEVQAICDRVIIIHKGQLVVDEEVSELKSSKEEFILTLCLAEPLRNGEFKNIEGVTEIEALGDRAPEFAYRIRAVKDVRRPVFECAVSKKLALLELKMERKSLEEIFHELTQ